MLAIQERPFSSRLVAWIAINLISVFIATPNLAASNWQENVGASSSDELKYWVKLAMTHAEDCDADNEYMVVASLARGYLISGDLEAYRSLMATVEDRERVANNLPRAAGAAAMNGYLELANELLNEAQGEDQKNTCRLRIANALLKQYKFDEAEKLVEGITDPIHESMFLEAKAHALAASGKWSEATDIVEQMKRPAEYELHDWNMSMTILRDFVKQCEDNKTVLPLEKTRHDVASQFRATAGLFSLQFDLADIDAAENKEASIKGAERRAAFWRAVAWHRIDHNEFPKARTALKKAVVEATKIEDPIARSIEFALAADAYFEIGDATSAKSLVAKTKAAEGAVTPLMRGLSSFTTGPIVMGVLIRAGETERVFHELKSKEGVSAVGWMALGMFCAEGQQLGFVKVHLNELRASSAKAQLAMGAALGLMTQTKAIHGTLEEK